jgi:hypothetical protein
MIIGVRREVQKVSNIESLDERIDSHAIDEVTEDKQIVRVIST